MSGRPRSRITRSGGDLRRVLDGLLAGGRFVELIAGAGQRCGQKLPNRQFVFDQQHASG